ncbi:hypothetical protein HB852_07090 [Listeria grandensis]|uniref:Uncharacterized protein n=1 Tax=Listeria grandensis FSL F6-0971 TaxID=1265819 RepID=W7BEH4_9LIST|nr:hypothetical protein [Listeria grandensis]EUJ23215.1 hypothetical protein PGRAN_09801 [Listeria grandensis FSL F6-0971]MBC1474379.1 hypothetical protein [Listeria grandensis]
MFELSLKLLSGIAWSIVYIMVIRIGVKEKTYGMPLVALGLNVAWESIYTYADVVLQIHGSIGIQTIINIIWVALDCIILGTFFKYGLKDSYFPKNKSKFVWGSILILGTCFAIQLAFVAEFGWMGSSDFLSAARYSAFVQNLAMSLLFINFFFMRQGARGQSITIAVAKWIGTLAPTILMGWIQSFNPFILIFGLLCSVFDIIYILLLINHKKKRPLSFYGK